MKLQIALAATPILYHLTNIRAAASIVQKNRFELKPSDGTDAEEALQGRASYYLSTARHKTASYTEKGLGVNSVIFTLNGVALASKYKIKSVDYWSGMYTDREEVHNRDRMEAEDRVMSNSPYIEKLERYVTAIHAYRGTEASEFGNKKGDKLIALYKFAKRHKIPIYFYNERASMLTLNTRKAVPLDRATLLNFGEDRNRPMTEYDYKYRKNNNELSGWLQLYAIPVKGDWKERQKLLTSDRAQRAYDNLRYHHNGDPLRQFNNALHNEKSTPYEYASRGREDLDKVIKLLRKHRWTSKQFIDFLHEKWFKED